MKIELVKKISDLIGAYKEIINNLNEEIKNIIAERTAVAIQHKLNPMVLKNSVFDGITDARNAAKSVAVVLNQKLKLIVEDARKQLFPNFADTNNHPADYTARASLALQFLSYQFDNLTDESAYLTLKEFTNDYNQMRLFKSVIEKHTDIVDKDGNHLFPKTFGKLIESEILLNTLNEIEMIAENLFTYPAIDGQSYIFGNVVIPLVQDSFEEIEDEKAIIKFANDVETMVNDGMSEAKEIEKMTADELKAYVDSMVGE